MLQQYFWKKLYQKFKKNTPLIQHTRLETFINLGVPDILCYNDLCGFFMVELKYTTTKKVRFSPHQILFHTQKSKRNFLLIHHAPPGLPSTIKLYESKSIGTIDSIKKNKAIVNYGKFTTQVDLEKLEYVK